MKRSKILAVLIGVVLGVMVSFCYLWIDTPSEPMVEKVIYPWER